MERKATQTIDRWLESVTQQIGTIKLQPENSRLQRHRSAYPEPPERAGLVQRGASARVSRASSPLLSPRPSGQQRSRQISIDSEGDGIVTTAAAATVEGMFDNLATPTTPRGAKSAETLGGEDRPAVLDRAEYSQNVEFGWKLPETIASELSDGGNFAAVLERWSQGLDTSTKILVIMALFVLGQRKLQGSGIGNLEKLKQLINTEERHGGRKAEWVRVLGGLALSLADTGKLSDYREVLDPADASALNQLIDHIGRQVSLPSGAGLQITPRSLLYASNDAKRQLLQGVYRHQGPASAIGSTRSTVLPSSSTPTTMPSAEIDDLLPQRHITLRIRKGHAVDHKARLAALRQYAKESLQGSIDATELKSDSGAFSATPAGTPAAGGSLGARPGMPSRRPSAYGPTSVGSRGRPTGVGSLTIKSRRAAPLTVRAPQVSTPSAALPSPVRKPSTTAQSWQPSTPVAAVAAGGERKIQIVDFDEGASVILDNERAKREKQQKDAEEREARRVQKKQEQAERKHREQEEKREERARKLAEREERKRKRQEELEARRARSSGRGRGRGRARKVAAETPPPPSPSTTLSASSSPEHSEDEKDKGSAVDEPIGLPATKRTRSDATSQQTSEAGSESSQGPSIDYRQFLPKYPDIPEGTDVDQIFRDATSLTVTECCMILDFLSGRTIADAAGPTKDVVLSRLTKVDPTDPRKRLVEQIVFQMNVATGEWRKLKRTAKKIAS